MKIFKLVALGLVIVIAALATYVFVEIRGLEVEKLSDDLFVLRGMGGNAAVLRTDEGAVIVDTMTLPLQGEQIRARARELTGMDTAMIINTHYHFDHTHGNPAFAQGTRVVATERTLSHLHAFDKESWQGDAAHLLPSETFTDERTLVIGGKTIQLIHPGRGHTDGDLVVLFLDEKVIHMGDLLFNKHYPNIDLEAGGSVKEWSATLETTLSLPFERVIPGHGDTTDKAGIRQFQTFMTELADLGQNAADNNTSLEDMLAADELKSDAGYEPIVFFVSIGLDRPFVLTRAWQEATGNFEVQN